MIVYLHCLRDFSGEKKKSESSTDAPHRDQSVVLLGALYCSEAVHLRAVNRDDLRGKSRTEQRHPRQPAIKLPRDGFQPHIAHEPDAVVPDVVGSVCSLCSETPGREDRR